MADWAAYMIFDSSGEICFGKTFNTSLSHENRFFLDLMAANVRRINVLGQWPLLKTLNVGRFLFQNGAEKRAKQISFSAEQLRNRLNATNSDQRDIIYYLQQARDQNTRKGYSEAELISETTLLLGAGSDTANSALTCIFYFLSQHLLIRERLTAIIRSAFPDFESISHGPALDSMVYLRACIYESMRLCPPVPMPLPREVLPGGLQVNGHQFQEGAIVGALTYSLHHSALHFDQPYVYDPARWLIKGSKGTDENEGRTRE